MARGSKPGERRGGRQKGTGNKKTQEIVARAAAGGITPLEVMMEAMREAYHKNDLKEAAGYAKDAAPYMHARLQATQHSGSLGLVQLTKEQHDAAMANFLAATD